MTMNEKDEKVLSKPILMKNVDARNDEKVSVNRSLEFDDDKQRHLLDAISIDRELSEKRRQDMIKVDMNLDLTPEIDQKRHQMTNYCKTFFKTSFLYPYYIQKCWFYMA